uniref:Uncharacterized protein n=1 Tax=Anguilla anguilla TaxID=7936 RepID=A0A0E9R7P4_ANGAN
MAEGNSVKELQFNSRPQKMPVICSMRTFQNDELNFK